MMLPFNELVSKYNMKINGIVNAGTHYAEEHNDYISCGINNFVYIEPCKNAHKVLIDKFVPSDNGEYYGKDYISIGRLLPQLDRVSSISILNFACSDKEGIEPMWVSHQNEGQSNSLLQPKLHLQQQRLFHFYLEHVQK